MLADWATSNRTDGAWRHGPAWLLGGEKEFEGSVSPPRRVFGYTARMDV